MGRDDAIRLGDGPAPSLTLPARAEAAPARITSMDQYRGYAVAGMFVVNFVGGLAAVNAQFKHNSYYFSLADSIMPSFLFAAGFSYRLTMLRRIAQSGKAAAYRHAVGRSLALILLSAAFYGLDAPFASWEQMTAGGVWEFVAGALKARLWNVLAIIGAAQLCALGVVALGVWARIFTAAFFLLVHIALSYSFNYEFVYGRPNAFDAWWGAAGVRAWDGGLLGPLMWAVPLLGGTLAYDAVMGKGNAFARLLAAGAGLMLAGYVLSCLSVAGTGAMFAEPPFVPPDLTLREPNYWMMDKRVVTAPFVLFSTGFAFATYALFVQACDRGGLSIGWLRMLGQNPLAAYLLHYPVLKSVRAVVPKDAPLWWCLVGLTVFFAIMTAFVRYLDRHKLYLRL